MGDGMKSPRQLKCAEDEVEVDFPVVEEVYDCGEVATHLLPCWSCCHVEYWRFCLQRNVQYCDIFRPKKGDNQQQGSGDLWVRADSCCNCFVEQNSLFSEWSGRTAGETLGKSSRLCSRPGNVCLR